MTINVYDADAQSRLNPYEPVDSFKFDFAARPGSPTEFRNLMGLRNGIRSR